MITSTASTQKEKLQEFINVKDRFGYAPLHYLAEGDSEVFIEKSLSILKLFLANPLCDINAKDKEGLPLIYWLILFKQSKLIKELLTSERLETFTDLVLHDQPSGLTESDRSIYRQDFLLIIEDILFESRLFLKYADRSYSGIIRNLEKLIYWIIEYYSNRFTKMDKPTYFNQLSSLSVMKILIASVWLLTDPDQLDLHKLLLERYFGLQLGTSNENEQRSRSHLTPQLDCLKKQIELHQYSSKAPVQNVLLYEKENLSPSLIIDGFEAFYKKILEIVDFDDNIDLNFEFDQTSVEKSAK